MILTLAWAENHPRPFESGTSVVKLKPVLTSPLRDAHSSICEPRVCGAQEGEAWTRKGPEAEQLGLEPRTGVGGSFHRPPLLSLRAVDELSRQRLA